MRIDVWSDITCPWCWLGKHHLEAALAQTGIRDAEVEYRSFQLSPGLGPSRPLRAYLAERYGDPARLEAAHARLAALGEAVGIRYDFERAVAADTFDAHRVHHLGKARGRGDAVVESLMRARQGEGADLGDAATLRRLGVEAGLDPDEVDEVLRTDRYADAVRADERAARDVGVQGVPFFLFDGRFALNGAHPVPVFVDALRRMGTPRDRPD